MLKLTNFVRTSLVDEEMTKKYVPFESYKKMSLILDLLMSSPEYNSKVVLSMPLKYKEYIRLRIRESTAASRFPMIERHILPFFKDKVISDINPVDIAAP